jgi:hypothetical protein
VNYFTAEDICEEGETITYVGELVNGALSWHACGSEENDFLLQKGRGYFIRISSFREIYLRGYQEDGISFQFYNLTNYSNFTYSQILLHKVLEEVMQKNYVLFQEFMEFTSELFWL